MSDGIIGTNEYTYTPPNALPGSVVAAPYQYTPVSPGQHNVALTTAQGLTVPVGAVYANLTVSVQGARYTTDGTTTPTSLIGQPIAAGASIQLSGAQLTNFKIIQVTAGALLDIEYFK